MTAGGMNILLVGCGKMGGALLQRWRDLSLYRESIVVEPSPVQLTNARRVTMRGEVPTTFQPDAVIFAVKPQTLPDMIGLYKNYAPRALFLSIVAGKSIAFFEEHLGLQAKIIRCMPNTPAAIGKGITVAVGNKNITDMERRSTDTLLGAVGEVLWVEQEALLNPVTALSGSGPAYVFLLIETMTKAGVKTGLPHEMAEKLARSTVIGSAVLAQMNRNVSAAQLRTNVTSPGGTTEAALNILMQEPAIQELFDRALEAATKRAEELSK